MGRIISQSRPRETTRFRIDKASELYRLLGDREKQRASLEAAADKASGSLHYSVESAIANLDLEDGRGDESIARLQTLEADLGDEFLAQQVAFDIGIALEHLDRKDDAVSNYDKFLAAWPDSQLSEDVSRRRRSLAGPDPIEEEGEEEGEELAPPEDEPQPENDEGEEGG